MNSIKRICPIKINLYRVHHRNQKGGHEEPSWAPTRLSVSEDKHGVTIGIKPVFILYSFFISIHD